MSRRTGGAVAILLVAAAVLFSACSSGSDDNAAPEGPATTIARPAGPAADLTEELTGGSGPFVASGTKGPDLAAVGWVEHEYVAAGTATSYLAEGELPADGRAAVTSGPTADYRTRIVVRRPADKADFDGTVVVEWLNVSGGLDAASDYTYAADELLRRGTAWVGVSAQQIGVEGGDIAVEVAASAGIAGRGLKRIDPARYGSLQHPGDAFSYDIYTQVARALRADDPSGVMGDLHVERLLAIGESQAGYALTTYADAVQPLTHAYDGFLIHSRGGAAMPLGEPGAATSIQDTIFGPPTLVRTDLDVPVLIIVTETDMTSFLDYHAARQEDTDGIRVWEVAGAAHTDRSQVGVATDGLACGVAVNDGPQRFAIRSGVRALDRWVRTGAAAAAAPRLDVDTTSDGSAVIVRDQDGNARGGLRFPQIEVPVATLSGEKGPSNAVICLLAGSTIPFSDARLAQLYASPQAYLDAYTAATDAAIADGFALAEDRDQILADANPSAITG